MKEKRVLTYSDGRIVLHREMNISQNPWESIRRVDVVIRKGVGELN